MAVQCSRLSAVQCFVGQSLSPLVPTRASQWPLTRELAQTQSCYSLLLSWILKANNHVEGVSMPLGVGCVECTPPQGSGSSWLCQRTGMVQNNKGASHHAWGDLTVQCGVPDRSGLFCCEMG